MLSRRERRFADREAEKILARMKRENNIINKQTFVPLVEKITLTDEMVEEYKEYRNNKRNGMQL